jgi:DNA-binding winged helix-turn-helix (wHTH) protein
MSRVTLSSCTVDLALEQVFRGEESIRLTSREACLLRFLTQHPHQPISRETLLSDVWGYSDGVVTRTIDTTVRRLRQKLEADPRKPTHLITVHGLGYRFEPLQTSDLPGDVSGEQAPWAPLGCPQPGASLSRLFEASRKLAGQRGDGFVGIEHLLITLSNTPSRSHATLQQICRSGTAQTRLGTLTVAFGERSPCWDGTPRLQRICATLGNDATTEDFWAAVLTDPHRGIYALDLGAAQPVNPRLPRRRVPTRRLEVIGGPEDGRILRPEPKDRIGRWWPERRLEHALFEGCVLEDSHLSRSGDLHWQEDSRALFKQEGTILRWHPQEGHQPGTTRGNTSGLKAIPVSAGESVVVHAWDLLRPTEATLLQALP